MPHTLEQRKRSIAKCVTWRTLAFVDTVLLSLIFTGSIGRALAIGGFEIATKTTLYYLHERAWLFIALKKDRRWPDPRSPFHETKRYCILKALSWRITGSIDTFFIALIITGDVFASSSIGAAEVLTKTVLYYLHERIWLRIGWGRNIERAPTLITANSMQPIILPQHSVPARQSTRTALPLWYATAKEKT